MKKYSKELYGKILKSSSLGGFEFSETAYPENLELPFHTHNFAYFCYVLEGDFTENYGRKKHLCKTSTLVYHPSGESHADHFHTPSRCFNFQLNSRFLKRLNDSKQISKINIIQKISQLDQLITRLYKEIYAVDEFSTLTTEGLMLEIIAEFLRQSKAGFLNDAAAPRWLVNARDFVIEEFANNLTISSIASVAGVHPTHLAREFRRYFHLTIGDFIRQRRVECARQKIITSNAPLSEIAAECGFFDQSHFTRVFKKATGMTPAYYRSTFQNR